MSASIPASPRSKLSLYLDLIRFNRPAGWLLLLWPTLWALWIAGKGSPSLINIVIFVLGVVLTRAGGCVINDWADRKVDGHVKRTEQRPLVSGKISSKEALVFFALLMGISFLLVLLTNATTILLSLGGLALAASMYGDYGISLGAILAALVILLANPSDFSFWVLMGYALLMVSAGLTLWSMVQYLRAAWPHLKTDVEKK